MSPYPDKTQKIGRLTPLKDVLVRIGDEVATVAAREIGIAEAVGKVLATEVVAMADHPPATIALRDGYAVRADDTADANSYAPVPLATAMAVQVGDALPTGLDAVLPQEGIVNAGGIAATIPIAGGDGVVIRGTDAQAGQPLLSAGHKLRAIDAAALQALGLRSVSVRLPRVRIVVARPGDAVLNSIAGFAERLVGASGSEIVADPCADLRAALSAGGTDFVIIAGGSGTGGRDVSVVALQDVGHLHFHGIGIVPGETSALGFIDKTPVLIVPGRIDAAFTALVTLGNAIMSRLSGHDEAALTVSGTLQRKVVSTIGLAEVVPVKLQQSHATPLASGYLSIQAMLQADGYIVVPADGEGYAAGSSVSVRMMP
jgi:molybdopterin biosynthesis enzyme